MAQDVAAIRTQLAADLDRIDQNLRVSALEGDDTDQGLIARIVGAVDAWALRRAQWAEQWRREHVPGYVPDTKDPPVPSAVLRRTAPMITDALKKGKSLPDLGRAALDDLAHASTRWTISLLSEVLPWVALAWLAQKTLEERRYGTH